MEAAAACNDPAEKRSGVMAALCPEDVITSGLGVTKADILTCVGGTSRMS